MTFGSNVMPKRFGRGAPSRHPVTMSPVVRLESRIAMLDREIARLREERRRAQQELNRLESV